MMSDICFEEETPYERAIFDLVDSGQARDDTVAEWARLLGSSPVGGEILR